MFDRREFFSCLTAAAVLTPLPAFGGDGGTKAGLVEVDGLPINVCQTGEPYNILVSGGIKGEGLSVPRWFRTPEEAWAAYHAQLAQYKQGKSGVLYWRARPQLDGWKGRMTVQGFDQYNHPVTETLVGPGGYSVYSRLVISDKPVLYKDMWEYGRRTQGGLAFHDGPPIEVNM